MHVRIYTYSILFNIINGTIVINASPEASHDYYGTCMSVPSLQQRQLYAKLIHALCMVHMVMVPTYLYNPSLRTDTTYISPDLPTAPRGLPHPHVHPRHLRTGVWQSPTMSLSSSSPGKSQLGSMTERW